MSLQKRAQQTNRRVLYSNTQLLTYVVLPPFSSPSFPSCLPSLLPPSPPSFPPSFLHSYKTNLCHLRYQNKSSKDRTWTAVISSLRSLISGLRGLILADSCLRGHISGLWGLRGLISGLKGPKGPMTYAYTQEKFFLLLLLLLLLLLGSGPEGADDLCFHT